MPRILISLFSDRDDAERAINMLSERGLHAKDFSIIMKDQGQAREMADTTGANVTGGAVTGATTGAVIGGLAGLLVGIGAIAVPGIGALLITGPLAAALGLTGAAATTVSGAITGALAGGLVGVLVSLGVPKEEAVVYEDRIKQGGVLLAVPATMANEEVIVDILERNNANNVRSLPMPKETTQLRDEDKMPADYELTTRQSYAHRTRPSRSSIEDEIDLEE